MGLVGDMGEKRGGRGAEKREDAWEVLLETGEHSMEQSPLLWLGDQRIETQLAAQKTSPFLLQNKICRLPLFCSAQDFSPSKKRRGFKRERERKNKS